VPPQFFYSADSLGVDLAPHPENQISFVTLLFAFLSKEIDDQYRYGEVKSENFCKSGDVASD